MNLFNLMYLAIFSLSLTVLLLVCYVIYDDANSCTLEEITQAVEAGFSVYEEVEN